MFSGALVLFHVVGCKRNSTSHYSASLCRYQYLELAHYLGHGYCPGVEDKTGYMMKANKYSDFADFVRRSSDVLNVEAHKGDVSFRAREKPLSSRIALRPLFTSEIRIFTYQDNKVWASVRSPPGGPETAGGGGAKLRFEQHAHASGRPAG